MRRNDEFHKNYSGDLDHSEFALNNNNIVFSVFISYVHFTTVSSDTHSTLNYKKKNIKPHGQYSDTLTPRPLRRPVSYYFLYYLQ